jgi:hypothetical protein
MRPKSTRRDFVLRGGAVLGAGVATTAAGVAALGKDGPALPGAGVGTTTAGAAALGKSPDVAAEREAIRRVQLALLSCLEQQDFAGAAELCAAPVDWHASGVREEAAAPRASSETSGLRTSSRTSAHSAYSQTATHSAYRLTSAQRRDEIAIGEDGAQATATFHVEAEVCTPIQGDCTAAQMARLQGNVASRHWESGRFDVKYAKTQGDWKIVSLRYERAPSTER